MSSLKAATIGLVIALLAVVFQPNAVADDWNRKTKFTFSAPVEIPGVHLRGWSVLPAGTYIFKVMDSTQDRHIVQIFSEDEKTVYATILAIPNYRLKATGKTVMTFSERPAGEPPALRAWFYPGRVWGEEFVYPKAKAVEIARTSETPVLYLPTDVASEVAEPIQAPSQSTVSEMSQAPVMAYNKAGDELPLRDAVTPPPAEEPPAAAPVQTNEPVAQAALPATASTLPLIAFAGLLALGGALSVRAVKRSL